MLPTGSASSSLLTARLYLSHGFAGSGLWEDVQKSAGRCFVNGLFKRKVESLRTSWPRQQTCRPPKELPPAAAASPPTTSRRGTTAVRWPPAGSHPPPTGSLRRGRAASPVRNLADLPRPAAPACSPTTPNKQSHPAAAAPPLLESRRHQPSAARPPQTSLPAPLAWPPPPTAAPAPPASRPRQQPPDSARLAAAANRHSAPLDGPPSSAGRCSFPPGQPPSLQPAASLPTPSRHSLAVAELTPR